ncbi:MAG: hypothetical protein ACRYG8_15350 [Janthinobacterium lividum]
MSTHRTILHDGEDFVLHHHRGNASYLIVTFIGSQQEGIATRDYLLSDLAEKYNIPCLGITCKTRNMYTSKEMDQVLSAAAPILRRYETVVAIGNSIGGYAAIKFSRRLGATHVFAVTPAYSLDVDELSFENAAERSRLEPGLLVHGISSPETLKGMAIRRQDVSGRVVVVHNPHVPVDAHQMKHLRATITLEEMPLQHDGHNVYSSLARPETMSKIIDVLRFSGSAALRREFRTIRRSIPSCIVPTLQRAMLRHPLLVHRALRSDAVAITPGLNGLDHGVLSNELAFRLAECGHETLAFDRIERMIRHGLGKAVRLLAEAEPGSTTNLRPGRHYLLLSTHGTFLCATSEPPRLTLSWNPFSTEGLTPVFASPSNDGLMLRTISHDGRISAPLHIQAGQSHLDWSRINGRIALRTTSGSVSANPDDTIQYGPAHVDRWEQFLPIAVDEPAGLVQCRSTGWLDASVQRMSESAADLTRSNAPPSRSSNAGWGRLFRFAGRTG